MTPFLEPIAKDKLVEMVKRLEKNAAVQSSLDTMPQDLKEGIDTCDPKFLEGMLVGIIRLASVTKMMSSAMMADKEDEAQKVQAVTQAIVYSICKRLEKADG